MKSQVCVDASLIVALLLPERFSPAALALWKEWTLSGWQVTAPMLIRYEVSSALYRKAHRNLISLDDSQAALQRFLALDLEILDPPLLLAPAAELAGKLNLPAPYDAQYLALSEHLDCPLWTGDERLYNAGHPSFPGLFWLGNYPL